MEDEWRIINVSPPPVKSEENPLVLADFGTLVPRTFLRVVAASSRVEWLGRGEMVMLHITHFIVTLHIAHYTLHITHNALNIKYLILYITPLHIAW